MRCTFYILMLVVGVVVGGCAHKRPVRHVPVLPSPGLPRTKLPAERTALGSRVMLESVKRRPDHLVQVELTIMRMVKDPIEKNLGNEPTSIPKPDSTFVLKLKANSNGSSTITSLLELPDKVHHLSIKKDVIYHDVQAFELTYAKGMNLPRVVHKGKLSVSLRMFYVEPVDSCNPNGKKDFFVAVSMTSGYIPYKMCLRDSNGQTMCSLTADYAFAEGGPTEAAFRFDLGKYRQPPTEFKAKIWVSQEKRAAVSFDNVEISESK